MRDLMEHPDPLVRERSAIAWCALRRLVLSLESNSRRVFSDKPTAAILAFVRICANYAANGAWLDEGRCFVTPIGWSVFPGLIIHGRV